MCALHLSCERGGGEVAARGGEGSGCAEMGKAPTQRALPAQGEPKDKGRSADLLVSLDPTQAGT